MMAQWILRSCVDRRVVGSSPSGTMFKFSSHMTPKPNYDTKNFPYPTHRCRPKAKCSVMAPGQQLQVLHMVRIPQGAKFAPEAKMTKIESKITWKIDFSETGYFCELNDFKHLTKNDKGLVFINTSVGGWSWGWGEMKNIWLQFEGGRKNKSNSQRGVQIFSSDKSETTTPVLNC